MIVGPPKVPVTFRTFAWAQRVAPEHIAPLWQLAWTLAAYKGQTYTLSEILDIEGIDARTLPPAIPNRVVRYGITLVVNGIPF